MRQRFLLILDFQLSTNLAVVGGAEFGAISFVNGTNVERSYQCGILWYPGIGGQSSNLRVRDVKYVQSLLGESLVISIQFDIVSG